jgi:hypothetical protein
LDFGSAALLDSAAALCHEVVKMLIALMKSLEKNKQAQV